MEYFSNSCKVFDDSGSFWTFSNLSGYFWTIFIAIGDVWAILGILETILSISGHDRVAQLQKLLNIFTSRLTNIIKNSIKSLHTIWSQYNPSCGRNCVTCFKAKPTDHQPIMGNLPKARIEPVRSFKCWPFRLQGSKGCPHWKTLHKCWQIGDPLRGNLDPDLNLINLPKSRLSRLQLFEKLKPPLLAKMV